MRAKNFCYADITAQVRAQHLKMMSSTFDSPSYESLSQQVKYCIRHIIFDASFVAVLCHMSDLFVIGASSFAFLSSNPTIMSKVY